MSNNGQDFETNLRETYDALMGNPEATKELDSIVKDTILKLKSVNEKFKEMSEKDYENDDSERMLRIVEEQYSIEKEYLEKTAVWRGGAYHEAELLADCYRNSLQIAEGRGIRSVVFPSISTGMYSYPVDEAAEIAVRTVRYDMG